MHTITCAQARQFDALAVEKYGVPSIVLMENAGRGLTDLLCRQNPKRVVICCGKGNNGGDGFVIARHLDLRDIPVDVFAIGSAEQYKGDALINLNIILKLGINVQFIPETNPDLENLASALEKADWIVDALLGTGAKGQPRAPFDTVINLINKINKKVLAVDLPSGLNGDDGSHTTSCIRATLTGSMGAIKTGLIQADFSIVGTVSVIDIGIYPKELL